MANKNRIIKIIASEAPVFVPPLVTSVHEKTKCKCGGNNVVKAGFVGKKQRYHCKDCKKRFVLNPIKRSASKFKRERAIELYLEGLSFRSAAKLSKISHVSLQRWVRVESKKIKNRIPLRADVIEIDELYYFVGKKKKTKGKLKPKKRWIWIAVCRETKRILSFQQGSRSRATLKKLTDKIKPISCSRYYTDEHVSFKGLLPKKKYTASKKFTYTVEGINSVLRHFLARFRRRTKCYCKSETMVYHTLNLFCHYYNQRIAA